MTAQGTVPFTCPDCGAVSYHPEDAKQGYCGRCKAFTGVDYSRRGLAALMRDGGREWPIFRGTPEHEQSMEWARFHGLDPNTIPAGSVIERDAGARCIRYTGFVYDPPESRDPEHMVMDVAGLEPAYVARVEQGEAAPMPFPWT